jgi:hypothetical protein
MLGCGLMKLIMCGQALPGFNFLSAPKEGPPGASHELTWMSDMAYVGMGKT